MDPLYIASQYGHKDVVDLLMNAGADIHITQLEVYLFSKMDMKLQHSIFTCHSMAMSLFGQLFRMGIMRLLRVC